MSARLFELKDITIAHKLTKILRRLILNLRGRLQKADGKIAIYKIKCEDCEKCCISRTRRMLVTPMFEDKLSAWRHDRLPGSRRTYIQSCHSLHSGIRELKTVKYFLEARSSSTNLINRHTKTGSNIQTTKEKDLNGNVRVEVFESEASWANSWSRYQTLLTDKQYLIIILPN